MPGKGYTTVTIRNEIHSLLKAIADKENRKSMSETILHVTKEYLKKLEGGDKT